MTSALLQSLVKSLGCLGFLLFIGMILRARVSIFRKLLIPASVLGGFTGLLFGPELLGSVLPITFAEDWVTNWSLLPSILIVPIFAAIPLGSFKKKSEKKAGSSKESLHTASRIAMVTSVHANQMGTQIVIGMAATIIMLKLLPGLNLYPCFGFEMSQGFNGGHGTAGAIANVLQEAGLERWELVQGVATTFATVGLLGGIILGIFHINRAASHGRTVFLKDSASLPDETSAGIVTDITKQESCGRETTANSNVECFSIHLGLIFLSCCLAYMFRSFCTGHNIPGFKEVPVWPYALIMSHIINFTLDKLNMQWLIDTKVKRHLSGMLADFAICAAIASMPIKAVMGYFGPIVVICILGFILVYCTTILAYRFLLPDSYPFERGIYTWGTGTGVMMTGMALLKVCDPNYDSPVLEDYSVANVMISLSDLFALPIMYHILCYGTNSQMFIFGCVYSAFFAAVGLIGKFIYLRTKE